MSSPRGARYDFLNALRGIAILAVMLLHFSERGVAADHPDLHAHLWPFLQHGYLGVQLFFVISGYCITAAMYGAAKKPGALRTFLYRRARRIFPPYWWSMALVVLMAMATCALMHKEWRDVLPLSVADWGFNLVLLQQPFGAPDASMVYWSLSIEFQFYTVMALCLVKPAWAEPLLMVVSALSMLSLGFPMYPIAGTFLAYWPEFACGIAANYLITRQHRFALTPWCLWGMAAATALLVWRMTPVLTSSDGRVTLPIKLAFCLICATAMVALFPYDDRICRTRWARWLSAVGVISYSLYLIHVPIGSRVFNLGARVTGTGGIFWLVYFGIAMIATLTVGVLFYRFCERPWINAAPARLSDAPPSPSLKISVVGAALEK